jgi:hypothetical protein
MLTLTDVMVAIATEGVVRLRTTVVATATEGVVRLRTTIVYSYNKNKL